MAKKMLSQTKEDYLRAIYRLMNRNEDVGVVSLAVEMELSKSTVSERLQELGAQKLVSYKKYSPINLTKTGFKLAEKLTYKHRIIEVFLHNVLKMPKDKIHQEAHKLEHAFSDEVIAKLADLVGNPEVDPHGQKIPKI